MNTERWQRVGDIFERLLEVPAQERDRHLESLCGADDELRGIVLSMLDSHEGPRLSDDSIATQLENSRAALADLGAGNIALRSDESAGTHIGHWRLTRKIGAGGMGVVWLAERADGQFHQRAALKLIKRGMDSEAVLARFLRERQILARLEHRNIAHLLDGGIAADGRPYFAMEYVEGEPLLAHCAKHNLKLEERLRLFLQVCTALRFAHSQHIVHRDIKPSNILVTADGSVKLLDFGIAKMLQDDGELGATLTATHREQPMTPAYAAPEQFSGSEVTEATDVYALGCVFYELLSGRRPHDFSAASSPHDVLKILLATDPVAPGKLKQADVPVPAKRLRGDLDTIALTALKQIPARRYPSVAAFAADIENYLSGNPIVARGDHFTYRTYKFFRRNRASVASLVTIAFIAAVGSILLWHEHEARGFLGSNPTAAVLAFNNLSQGGEGEWIEAILSEQIASELAVSEKLRVLPGDLVHNETRDLPRASAGGYGQPALATLRKRLDADFVLSGSYAVSVQAGETTLRIDISLQDTRNGRIRASFSDLSPVADLPGAIERAGVELRRKLGAGDVQSERLQEVAKARPATAEIGRHIGKALDAMRRSDPARAVTELSETVALAPGYAPAYMLLARAWSVLGYDAKALAYAEKAVTYEEGLPATQKLQIERELAVQKGDWRRVLEFDAEMTAADASNPDILLATIRDMLLAHKAADAENLLANLRKLPGMSADPRVELVASSVAEAQGNKEMQAEHSRLALQQAEARDERALAADAIFNLSLAKHDMGDDKEAEELMRKAVGEYQLVANPGYEADAHLNLAMILSAQNRTREARDEYLESHKLYERIGNRHRQALVYGDLAILHANLADQDSAENAAASALRLAREIGDQHDEAWALGLSAANRLNESASDEVMAFFSSALNFSSTVDAKRDHASILESYSEALRLRGELSEAKVNCAQALTESNQLGIPARIMKAEYQCAIVARDLGNRTEAEAGFGRAAALATRLRSVAIATKVAIELTAYEIADEHWSAAKGRLVAAVGSLENTELVGEEARVQALLGLVLGNLKRPVEMEAALARAHELRNSITSPLVAFPVDLVLAQIPKGDQMVSLQKLENLAAEATKRSWVALALEAKLVALRIAERFGDARAPTLRDELATSARAHHSAWVLSRLDRELRDEPKIPPE